MHCISASWKIGMVFAKGLLFYFHPYFAKTFLKIGSSDTEANNLMLERIFKMPRLLKIS
jgi:hypothetical protein